MNIFYLDWSGLDAGGARADLEPSDVYQRQESSSLMDNQSEHMYDSSNLGVSTSMMNSPSEHMCDSSNLGASTCTMESQSKHMYDSSN